MALLALCGERGFPFPPENPYLVEMYCFNKIIIKAVFCCWSLLLIAILCRAQTAHFTFSQNCGLVQFINQSIGAETYLWDFGDGEQSILESPAHFYTEPGDYTVSLTIANSQNEGDFYSDVVNISASEPLPYLEDFEDGLADNWQLFKPNEIEGWEIAETDCNGDVLLSQNFGSTIIGEESILYGRFDLTNVSNGQISMDYAYAQANTESNDELKVRLTICEFADTYTGFEKAGAELATAPMQETAFIPDSCDDWQTETVDLGLLEGFTVVFQFISVNNGGNNIYIDNITFSGDVETSLGTLEQKDFELYPNPANEILILEKVPIIGIIELQVLNLNGGLVRSHTIDSANQTKIPTSDLENGIYLIKIGAYAQKILVQH